MEKGIAKGAEAFVIRPRHNEDGLAICNRKSPVPDCAAEAAEPQPAGQPLPLANAEHTGKLIDSQNEVGGYPNYTPTSHTLSVPETSKEQWVVSLSEALIP